VINDKLDTVSILPVINGKYDKFLTVKNEKYAKDFTSDKGLI